MPSTRISMCLICACATGPITIDPSTTSSAIRFVFIVPPSLKVQPELLRDSEADAAADGHKQCAIGVDSVPIHPQPKVHSGAHTHVGGDSGEQNVATAPNLRNSRDAVIRRMQPRKHRA